MSLCSIVQQTIVQLCNYAHEHFQSTQQPSNPSCLELENETVVIAVLYSCGAGSPPPSLPHPAPKSPPATSHTELSRSNGPQELHADNTVHIRRWTLESDNRSPFDYCLMQQENFPLIKRAISTHQHGHHPEMLSGKDVACGCKKKSKICW